MNGKVRLKEKDEQPVNEFKARLLKEFPRAECVLFGSKVNGKDSDFSDIDLLVLLETKVDVSLEKKIFDIGFEVGLRFEAVFGIVVEERKFWNSDIAKAMPFYQNIAER